MSKKQKIELFPVAGNNYFFDLEELSQFIRIEKTENIDDILGEAEKELQGEIKKDDLESQIIDITKWEAIKVMMECVLNEHSPVDEAMGFGKLSEQLSIPFRLSFNTLIKHNIIKEENGR
jgi:predicted RNA-binding protein